MSLNALSNATAGLAATQAAINVVSQNVANAGTAGYVKRTLTPVATGTNNLGVAAGTVTRSFDAAALNQLRLETSGAAYTSTKSGIIAQLDALYGSPGSSTALDGTLNTFTQSLQQLSANPTSPAARTTVLSDASALASQINSAANTVQTLRTGIEAQLGSDTGSASALLSSIANLNTKIQNTTDSSSLADLQDQRDQAVNGLSSYMDVKTTTQRDGTVTVLTQSGATLVDRGNAATLSFDGRGTLSANSSISSTPRSVGTITATLPGGGKIDLGEPGVLRSGSLAAQLELRDQTLPQAQRQLDDLAAGLSSSLTDKQVPGTSDGTSATIDPTGMKAGNTITIPVTVNGTVRNVILIASGSAAKSVPASETDDSTALVQTFQLPTGTATFADSINAALGNLGVGLTATMNGASVAIAPSAGSTTKATGATANVTAVSTTDLYAGNPSLALFVDGTSNTLFTGTFDGGSQLTGFAQRIAVNSNVSGDTAALSAAASSTSATNTNASGARAQQLYAALTATQQTFSSSSGIGGISAPYHASVTGFAQDIISAQGAASANATALDGTQQTALATAQSRFAAGAGVNIDQEMSNLIALQTAYGANARVLTAARDMLNQLLQI